jgi:RNA polymerase sigma-70 factor, ECF subfamily
MSLRRSTAKANAFLELLQPLQGRLEGYCRRMLRKRDQVEDVLQSVVALAFSQFDRYAEGTNFKAWIFRIATLEIFNRNRKSDRRREAVSIDELPGDLLADESWPLVEREEVFSAMLKDPEAVLDQFDDVVTTALEDLAPRERAALLLRSLGDFSYDEIHQLLDIPVGSVIGYLSRARQRLRLSLATYADQHGFFKPHPSQREAPP